MEFTAPFPKLKKIERCLQNADATMGLEKRFYIEEIMQELTECGGVEVKLPDEIE